MRLDIRTDDSKTCREHHAFLNGREIKSCIMADEEEGIMLVQGRTEFFAEDEYVTRPHPTTPFISQQQITVKGKVELRKI